MSTTKGQSPLQRSTWFTYHVHIISILAQLTGSDGCNCPAQRVTGDDDFIARPLGLSRCKRCLHVGLDSIPGVIEARVDGAETAARIWLLDDVQVGQPVCDVVLG